MPATGLRNAARPLAALETTSYTTTTTSPRHITRLPSRSTPSHTASAAFSTTTPLSRVTRKRLEMMTFLKGRLAESFRDNDVDEGPNYLGEFPDQPFPQNPLFRSQPVLSEGTREMIWERIVRGGEPLKVVSANFGIDVRRVAAVVRMKVVEKQWKAEGKKLATPYAKAVMRMLPQNRFDQGADNLPAHEPVNDIPMHPYTLRQLFVPVSESRHFTREDAAKAFDDELLSADGRSPQPQLISMERRLLAVAGGDAEAEAVATEATATEVADAEVVDGAEETDKNVQKKKKSGPMSRFDSMEIFTDQARKEEEEIAERIMEAQEQEESRIKRVQSDRYEFRFNFIDVHAVGKDGRSRAGTGWRYGAPHDDRKKGLVKIPTSVP